jgi:hypothetical protein
MEMTFPAEIVGLRKMPEPRLLVVVFIVNICIVQAELRLPPKAAPNFTESTRFFRRGASLCCYTISANREEQAQQGGSLSNAVLVAVAR